MNSASSFCAGDDDVMKEQQETFQDLLVKRAKSSVSEKYFFSEKYFSKCIKRKLSNQNVFVRLSKRERGENAKSNYCEFLNQRKFYLSVTPNATVSNVEKPPCFLRKFSPNGRFLIAFSSHQSGLEIYEYRGVAAANDILQRCTGLDTWSSGGVANGANWSTGGHTMMTTGSIWSDDGVATNSTNSNNNAGTADSGISKSADSEQKLTKLRQTLFGTLFKLRHVTTLATENEQLNRECSLFTSDSRYVIVVASVQTSDEQSRHYAVYRNNESLTLSPQNPLEDYYFYCVDLTSGHVTDTKLFKCDKIYLAHNQGVCLYDRTLAVLSVQHQTVYLFNLTNEGILEELHNIGRYVYDDDDMLMNSPQAKAAFYGGRGASGNMPRAFPVHASADPMFTALKQRLLAYFYRAAADARGDARQRLFTVRDFFRRFDTYVRLRLWRMQLLDADNLLLRYASDDVVACRVDSTQQPSYFVFYNITSTQIFAVYENTDEAVLKLYENYADHFRAGGPRGDRFPCSVSSSGQARKNHDRYKQIIVNARFGGQTEAVKRIVAQLPLFSQSFSPSPYLDLELFSFDEKWLSALERPKQCGDFPIRIYGRDSGLLKFQMFCGVRNAPPPIPLSLPMNQRSLVAFIFHPYEPFAISVQRNNRDYIVNFHLRNPFSAD